MCMLFLGYFLNHRKTMVKLISYFCLLSSQFMFFKLLYIFVHVMILWLRVHRLPSKPYLFTAQNHVLKHNLGGTVLI